MLQRFPEVSDRLLILPHSIVRVSQHADAILVGERIGQLALHSLVELGHEPVVAPEIQVIEVELENYANRRIEVLRLTT